MEKSGGRSHIAQLREARALLLVGKPKRIKQPVTLTAARRQEAKGQKDRRRLATFQCVYVGFFKSEHKRKKKK